MEFRYSNNERMKETHSFLRVPTSEFEDDGEIYSLKRCEWFLQLIRWTLITLLLLIVFREAFRIPPVVSDPSAEATTISLAKIPKASSNIPEPSKVNMYIVVILGCSQSTSISAFAQALLNAHGIQVEWYQGWEVLHKHKNRLLQEHASENITIAGALKLQYEHALRANKSVIVKFDDAIHGSAEMSYVLNQIIKPKVVYIWRSNLLDRMVCKIRDCFNNIKGPNGKNVRFGHSVLASSGEKTTLCFDRRSSDQRVKAFIYSNVFAKVGFKLHQREVDNLWSGVQTEMFGHIWDLPKVASEDLWAFQAEGDRGRSLLAWREVSYAWDLPFNEDLMNRVMDSYIQKNGIHVPKSHDETIYNLQQLLDRFGDDKNFTQFLRT